MDKLDNKEGSEIVTVQNLIAALDIEGVIFSEYLLCIAKKNLQANY